ncbi:MAG: DnaB-like helicase C-terminal domain-containing protein, partial [Candidatus Brocadiales bacterium]
NIYKGAEDAREIVLFEEGRRDTDLFTIANALIKSAMPEEQVAQVLERLILSWGEPVDQKWLKAKVLSALKRKKIRESNLAEEVREWVLSSNGVFLSSDVVKCLHLSSRDEQKNLSKVLERLITDNVIERYGKKNGCFRKKETRFEVIDYKNADGKSLLDIQFPFRLHEMVKIMPKNIIVVAGEPNAGKTALLLNTIRLNMKKHEVWYFSSEMGALELRERLSRFDMPIADWNFNAVERSSDFQDVIKPNALNIIDFLEVHDEFYKIGGMIRSIYDKLDKGIAMIAIQKNKNTDFGLGGMRSLEKPRLYLAMEQNRLKIVKAKNWLNSEVNPNGLVLDFKLVQGCKFIATSSWKKENPQNR